jgi:ribosomal protein S18 acetylase RimI-like enzyme
MTRPAFSVRAMVASDIAAVERIYKAHVAPGSARSRRQIRARIEEAVAADGDRAVALVGVDARDRVVGYLVGDVRSWEFGSEPAGWIFALGVDPRVGRLGLGGRLLEAAVGRFAALGIQTVRTMVRRDDVPVLRFFRSEYFSAGRYLELELEVRLGAAVRSQRATTREA